MSVNRITIEILKAIEEGRKLCSLQPSHSPATFLIFGISNRRGCFQIEWMYANGEGFKPNFLPFSLNKTINF